MFDRFKRLISGVDEEEYEIRKKIKYFEKKAKKGDFHAQRTLGELYYDIGEEEKAEYWLSQASTKGDKKAKRELKALKDGDYLDAYDDPSDYYDDLDYEELQELKQEASKGDEEACLILAEYYEEEGNINAAIKYYEKGGYTDEANELKRERGDFKNNNKSNQNNSSNKPNQKNYNSSPKVDMQDLCYRAELGEPNALCQLAKMYSEGDSVNGIKKDINKAISLYKRAGATNKVKQLEEKRGGNNNYTQQGNKSNSSLNGLQNKGFIFISYSRSDANVAYPIIRELEKRYKVWYDKRDIEAGSLDWRKSILEGIRKSAFVIFLVSNSTLKSDNCINERFHCEQTIKKEYVNVMLYRDIVLTDEFNYGNARKQHFNFYEYNNDFQTAINALESSCNLFKKYPSVKK